MCRRAINAANGDIGRAYDFVVQWLIDDVVSRTGVARDQAVANLTSTGFDVERAISQWKREHPGPGPSPQDKLASGMELAATVLCANADFRRFLHIIPISGGFEIRLITHLARYTEDAYGWDYDDAISDPTTRLTREIVTDVQAAFDRLAHWGICNDSLVNPYAVDSCLVNSPLEAYLGLPHLSGTDNTETA